MAEKDDLLYDEEDSVKFIQNYLPQEMKGRFSSDDICYIVDLIYEYYESKGYLEESDDENADIQSLYDCGSYFCVYLYILKRS